MVKVYSSPECSWCQKVKKYLTVKGVEYQDFNVVIDTEAREEMVALTGEMNIPVTQFANEEYLVGFDKAKFDEMLSK